jgi:hypothetical protein
MDCPLVVIVRKQTGSAEEIRRARLCNIGDHGARFCSCGPIEVGTNVIVRVSFPYGPEGVSTLEFDGVVIRSQPEPPHESAVFFLGRGRIYSSEAGHDLKKKARAVPARGVDTGTVPPCRKIARVGDLQRCWRRIR